MTELELKSRLKSFSIRIIKMVDSMPSTISSMAIAKQVILPKKRVESLFTECQELLKIISSSILTMKQKLAE